MEVRRMVQSPRWCLVLLAWLAGALVLCAQEPRPSAQDQKKKADELIKSAQQSQSMAVLAVQIGVGFIALGLLWGAYSTARKGFKISESNRIEGPGAYTIAAVLAVAAIGFAVWGIVYLPGMIL
jgi:hypothetical protein